MLVALKQPILRENIFGCIASDDSERQRAVSMSARTTTGAQTYLSVAKKCFEAAAKKLQLASLVA
jgi:hypothetical protein